MENSRRLIRCLALALLLVGCGPNRPAEPVQEIAVRKSGPASLDIVVKRTGVGSFEQFNPDSQLSPLRNGTFRVSSNDFDKIEARFAEFRKEAVPLTDASLQEMMDRRCGKGVPYVTHRGSIYVRWDGKGFDQHYLAKLGCDDERTADQKQNLGDAFRTLTVLTGLP